MTVSAIYDRHFFARQLRWREEYDAIADTLVKHMPFSSVLDLGCGSAFLITRLARHGKSVLGIDGSSDARVFAAAELHDKILTHDLTSPIEIGRYDLVICTEVAEHLPAAHADTLVSSICRNAGRWVFFTAALPGQGGHGHVNEQPHGYWIDRFRERGWALDAGRTAAFRRELSERVRIARWFPMNALLFSVEGDEAPRSGPD